MKQRTELQRGRGICAQFGSSSHKKNVEMWGASQEGEKEMSCKERNEKSRRDGRRVFLDLLSIIRCGLTVCFMLRLLKSGSIFQNFHSKKNAVKSRSIKKLFNMSRRTDTKTWQTAWTKRKSNLVCWHRHRTILQKPVCSVLTFLYVPYQCFWNPRFLQSYVHGK